MRNGLKSTSHPFPLRCPARVFSFWDGERLHDLGPVPLVTRSVLNRKLKNMYGRVQARAVPAKLFSETIGGGSIKAGNDRCDTGSFAIASEFSPVQIMLGEDAVFLREMTR